MSTAVDLFGLTKIAGSKPIRRSEHCLALRRLNVELESWPSRDSVPTLFALGDMVELQRQPHKPLGLWVYDIMHKKIVDVVQASTTDVSAVPKCPPEAESQCG